MTAIGEIKARLDIVDIVSENVQLRRSGKNFTGFCPFHPNTRTPAFVVFQETGTWRWALLEFGYMTVLAYSAAFVTDRLVLALGGA